MESEWEEGVLDSLDRKKCNGWKWTKEEGGGGEKRGGWGSAEGGERGEERG